jgi:hypothetical protein
MPSIALLINPGHDRRNCLHFIYVLVGEIRAHMETEADSIIRGVSVG